MKRLALATAILLGASPNAFAQSDASIPVIVEEATVGSSANGIIIPLILLSLLVVATAGGGD